MGGGVWFQNLKTVVSVGLTERSQSGCKWGPLLLKQNPAKLQIGFSENAILYHLTKWQHGVSE